MRRSDRRVPSSRSSASASSRAAAIGSTFGKRKGSFRLLAIARSSLRSQRSRRKTHPGPREEGTRPGDVVAIRRGATYQAPPLSSCVAGRHSYGPVSKDAHRGLLRLRAWPPAQQISVSRERYGRSAAWAMTGFMSPHANAGIFLSEFLMHGRGVTGTVGVGRAEGGGCADPSRPPGDARPRGPFSVRPAVPGRRDPESVLA